MRNNHWHLFQIQNLDHKKKVILATATDNCRHPSEGGWKAHLGKEKWGNIWRGGIAHIIRIGDWLLFLLSHFRDQDEMKTGHFCFVWEQKQNQKNCDTQNDWSAISNPHICPNVLLWTQLVAFVCIFPEVLGESTRFCSNGTPVHFQEQIKHVCQKLICTPTVKASGTARLNYRAQRFVSFASEGHTPSLFCKAEGITLAASGVLLVPQSPPQPSLIQHLISKKV